MLRLRPLVPFAILAVFAVLAAEPLAREPMTCSDDGPFHLYRAVQLGALLEAGHWFPRWAPHMAQGYGFPFFNFYAPLSSYFIVLLHRFGLEYPAALKLAFALAIWLAGCAAYLPARERWGERAGLVAGVAYLFAPYLAYDVLFRANFAETLAFVWPPLILWSIQRSEDKSRKDSTPSRTIPTHRPWILTSLSYAALILTHNIFALIASPLFIGYLALGSWRRRSWAMLLRGTLALTLGIALTAYFWLPALAERGLIHSDRLLVAPIFTWNTNFITVGELLAGEGANARMHKHSAFDGIQWLSTAFMPRAADPLLINPSPARTIGGLTVLLGLPAVFGLMGRVRAQWRAGRQGLAREEGQLERGEWDVGFLALALAGYCFLTLAASEPLWRLIRPLELVQFPWRMLGPAALCAALLVGASVHAAERLSRLAAPTAITLIILGTLSYWSPRYCASPATATLGDMVGYERATRTIGTTAKGEYLPRTVDAMPDDSSLADAILRGEEPVRLQRLEGEAEWQPLATMADPLNATFLVTARTPATFLYRQFLYPGWQAVLRQGEGANGQPLTLRAMPRTGLIILDLPPGRHLLHITFGSTPLRTAASSLSVVALLITVGLGVKDWKARSSSVRSPTPTPLLDLGLLAFALLALKLAVIDRTINPLRQSAFDGERVAGVQTPMRFDFAGGLGFYGYDLSTRTLPADDGVEALVYVSMRTPALRQFWPLFYVKDAAGLDWTGADSYLPPRWHREPPPTSEWAPENYAQWARRVVLLPGTPPGDYELWGEVIDRETAAIQSVLDAQGNAIQPRYSLGTLTVTRPRRPFQLQPEVAAEHRFGPITFLGYGFDRAEVMAGDALRLTWYWRSQSATTRDLPATLQLRAADGSLAFSAEMEPANAYPVSRWQPGDQWRGQQRVVIPAALPSGEYRWTVSVPGEAGEQELGSVRITTPARVFEPPALAQSSGAQFADVGELAGYSIQQEGGTLRVQLVWRAMATPAQSYLVFVHFGDETRVLAQHVSVPVGGARPTTSWLAGEYLIDTHTLVLPGDEDVTGMALYVGLFDPQTQQRVAASGAGAGEDHRVRLALTP